MIENITILLVNVLETVPNNKAKEKDYFMAEKIVYI
jgi:hypothetical protein